MIETILYSNSIAGYYVFMLNESYRLNSNNSITLKVKVNFYKLEGELEAIDRNHLEYTGYFPILVTANDDWAFLSISHQLFSRFKAIQKEKYGYNDKLENLQLSDFFKELNKQGCIRNIFADAAKKETVLDESDFVKKLEDKRFNFTLKYWNKLNSLQQIADELYKDSTDYQYKYLCIPKEKSVKELDILWYLRSLIALGENVYKIKSSLVRKAVLYQAILKTCNIVEKFNIEPYRDLIVKYREG